MKDLLLWPIPFLFIVADYIVPAVFFALGAGLVLGVGMAVGVF